MSKKKKTTIIKVLIFIIAISLFVGIIAYLFPVMKNLSTHEGQIAFKARIEESGVYGFLTLLGLQFAQIVFPVLPGEPIEILAGMCYGTIGGFCFITISIIIITTTIFFLVRKIGRSFVYTVVSKEKIDKIENSKLFKHPKKIEYIMLILYFIPGTPKDLLTYIAGLLPINPKRFIIISTLARFPSIISSTYAGATLIEGDWHMGLIMYGIIFLIVGIVALVAKKFDKSNITKDILDESKKI